MDKFEIKGNWDNLKAKLKKRYENLTDVDLSYSKGDEERLLGKLQKKIGKSREEIISMIKSM
jgi:uncharacterized protein YjbJ (UPF0337 family)